MNLQKRFLHNVFRVVRIAKQIHGNAFHLRVLRAIQLLVRVDASAAAGMRQTCIFRARCKARKFGSRVIEPGQTKLLR
jgi:hypothetical protein